MKHIKLLGNRVLVKLIEQEQEGKIIIPDKHKVVPTKGIVIKVGIAKNSSINDAAVGDTVYVSKYGGTKVIIDDVELKMFDESELLAKVESK